jgi:hypothetical protein
MRQIECRRRISEGAHGAEGERDYRDCNHREADSAREIAVRGGQKNRQKNVKLFFDCKRPGMDQRYRLNRRAEIAGMPPEVKVGQRKQGGQKGFSEAHQLRRKEVKISQETRPEQGHDQGGENTPDAAFVKRSNGEFSGSDILEDNGADQVAGDHKKYVHSDESAPEPADLEVVGKNRKNSNCAESVDIRAIVKAWRESLVGLRRGRRAILRKYD